MTGKVIAEVKPLVPKLAYQAPSIMVMLIEVNTDGSNLDYIFETQGGGPYES